MGRRSVLRAAIGIGLAVLLPGASFARAQDATPITLTFGTPTVDDIALLKKSVDTVQKNGVLVVSSLHVRGGGSGVFITINEEMRVTGHFPGKFHSTVRLMEEDGKTTAAQFEVTGDGTNVYTYRVDTQQYGVQSVEAFKANFNAQTPSVGVLCGVIASGPSWGEGEPPADAAGVAAFLEAGKTVGFILESAAGKGGQRVFELRPVVTDASGLRIRMTADPATGGFVGMEMSGKMGEMKFAITENIRSMAKLSDDALGNFTFVPPPGAKKVEKLSVWPF